jgi:hypothetical protein
MLSLQDFALICIYVPWTVSTEARRSFGEINFVKNEKPSCAKASEGEGGD